MIGDYDLLRCKYVRNNPLAWSERASPMIGDYDILKTERSPLEITVSERASPMIGDYDFVICG